MNTLALTGSPELQRIFNQRTATIYRYMMQRVAKGGMSGAQQRAGHAVPFSSVEFASWVLKSFEGRVDRVVQCAYCSRFVSVASFVVDHRIPVGWPWHGSSGLHNLTLSCASCNQRKGCMSDEGFRRLMQWSAASLDRRDVLDMLKRLSNGSMAKRLLEEDYARKKTQQLRAQSDSWGRSEMPLFGDTEVA